VWFYRLAKTKYLDSAFSGDGAKHSGGRWNNEGVPCVYGSLHEAQAILEVYVHLQSAQPLDSYTFSRIKLNESDVFTMSPQALPAGWNNPSGSRHARAIGDGWLRSGESLALIVPSVFTRHESNILINPEHPDLESRLTTLETWPFKFDSRLVKG